MAKTFLHLYHFKEICLCFTDQETRKENVLSGPTPLWVSQLSLVQSSRSIQRMRKVPWPKHFFYFFNVLGRFVFASQTQKSQE